MVTDSVLSVLALVNDSISFVTVSWLVYGIQTSSNVNSPHLLLVILTKEL
jgi:hypothetical protein